MTERLPAMDASLVEGYLRQLAPEQLQDALAAFVPATASREERVAAIEGALNSPMGPLLRAEMGRWITEKLLPFEALVPETYQKWRAPVRDAMQYVVTHLSEARLAPKILEQLELPAGTRPEERLLKLIAKVPGLQKLGQVLSRNKRLRPGLRSALAELENGIRDVQPEEIIGIIGHELGPRLKTLAVKIEPTILSEASVSAVVRFSWRDRNSRRRQRGVFKVLKPYIPACFAEDMDILQGLAEWFGSKYRDYGFGKHVLTDTFTKVRRLLQHEVDYPREQHTLLHGCDVYRSIPGVRVPRVVRELCTPRITAITEEQGVKVTTAAAHLKPSRRGRLAGQLVEALVAAPLFAAEDDVLFHADPHAGNVLYDSRAGELVLLDWALTERLSREQRRHVALLVVAVGLRDPVGASREIVALSHGNQHPVPRQVKAIRAAVASFFESMPLTAVPGPVDAMVLLERIAMMGVRFPAPLIMFSKVLFTLDGILHEIAGSGMWMGATIATHVVHRWLMNPTALGSPLTKRDWLPIGVGALLYGGRVFVQWEQSVFDRLLPAA